MRTQTCWLQAEVAPKFGSALAYSADTSQAGALASAPQRDPAARRWWRRARQVSRNYRAPEPLRARGAWKPANR